MSTPVLPTSIRLARALLFLRGGWFLISVLVVIVLGGIPAQTLAVAGGLLVLASLYGFAGFALSKRRRIGGWLAVATVIAVLALSAINRSPSPGLLVDVAILVAVLLGWRHISSTSHPLDA